MKRGYIIQVVAAFIMTLLASSSFATDFPLEYPKRSINKETNTEENTVTLSGWICSGSESSSDNFLYHKNKIANFENRLDQPGYIIDEDELQKTESFLFRAESNTAGLDILSAESGTQPVNVPEGEKRTVTFHDCMSDKAFKDLSDRLDNVEEINESRQNIEAVQF